MIRSRPREESFQVCRASGGNTDLCRTCGEQATNGLTCQGGGTCSADAGGGSCN